MHRNNGSDTSWLRNGQVIGAVIAGAILLLLTKVVSAPDLTGGHGTNAVANAGGAGGAFLVEFIATFLFVFVVLGTTDSKVGAGNFAGLAIGLSLILIHLVCIRLTGTSVNPARSIGPALFAGGQALKDLWIFIVAPPAAEPSAPSYGQHSRQQLTRSSFSTCHPKP